MNFPDKKKIHNCTCLLFIIIYINETGTENPRKPIQQTCKYDRREVIFHIDMNVCLLFLVNPYKLYFQL